MSVDRPTNERMRVSGSCHVFTMLFASRRAERVGLGRAERVEEVTGLDVLSPVF
jgi:hypothetical protein